MHRNEPPSSLQHPALHAALSARNAIAAEMAIAGRMRHHPDDPVWDRATEDALASDNACWILASEAYARMQWDLACADAAVAAAGHAAPEDPAMARAKTMAALAVPVGSAAKTGSALRAVAPPRKPAARRRREILAMIFWFLVGGAGGLLALMAIRGTEVVLAWR